MPSLASFLSVDIPKEKLMEIDGIPLTGKVLQQMQKPIW
jgi:hypothetical protein